MAFAILALVLVLGLTEATAYLGLFVAQRALSDPPRRVRWILNDQSLRIRRFLASPNRREVVDSVLGWRYRPVSSAQEGFVNQQGLRSARIYDPVAAKNVTRVAAFGDSFVYGSEVRTKDAWPARIEADFPTIEVLNYGVPGYGVDQALLRYKLEGLALAPHYVIMGFAPDDLRRVVNVYRRFISTRERPLSKPRFLQEGEQLVLLPPPLRDTSDYRRLLDNPRMIVQFGRHDQWYEPGVYENPLYDWSATVRLGIAVWGHLYDRFLDDDRLFDGTQFNRSSAAFQLQVTLLKRFAEEVEAAGLQPLILFFPDREALAALSRRELTMYSPLMDAMKEHGIDFVDLARAFPSGFDSATLASWFASQGHYSPAGNRLIASAVAASIRAHESRALAK